MKGKRLCFFCLRHNANYREFNANFRKLIQFMLSLSKYLRQTQGFMQTQERTHLQTSNNSR